jgi:hypothetical protein
MPPSALYLNSLRTSLADSQLRQQRQKNELEAHPAACSKAVAYGVACMKQSGLRPATTTCCCLAAACGHRCSCLLQVKNGGFRNTALSLRRELLALARPLRVAVTG